MQIRNTRSLCLIWFLCIQCLDDVVGMCSCCCKIAEDQWKCMQCKTDQPVLSNCPEKCKPPTDSCDCSGAYGCGNQCEIDESTTDDSTDITVVVVVSCSVVVVSLAILITICYWIRNKHGGHGSNSQSNVGYAAGNEKDENEDEASAVTLPPLPPIPVENDYTIPTTSQQNTYEQIDPGYSSLQGDNGAATNKQSVEYTHEYTTIRPNTDTTKSNSPVIPDNIEATNLKKDRDQSETPLYSNVSKDTLQKDGDSDITATSPETDIEEESYSKLNHFERNVPDDATDDYNKLIATPVTDEESEEYSHLNRTSLNMDESVTDHGYGKLELPIKPAAGTMKPTPKSNDGYEETLPSLPHDDKPKDVTPEVSPDKPEDNSHVGGAKTNSGYEEPILLNASKDD